MNSDQIVYTTGPAYLQSNATTAHSRAVHVREMSHLNNETMLEGKRATRETELAFKDNARASKEYAKAAKKGHGRRSRRHEAKGDQFYATANSHHLNAMESQAEIDRAKLLQSLPARGTLPTTQVMNSTTVSSVAPTLVRNTYFTPMAASDAPVTTLPVYSSLSGI